MASIPLARERNTSRFRVSPATAYTRQVSLGLPTAYAAAGSEAITCHANQVALIDQIILTGRSKDSAANQTITLRINGIDCPFHFAGEANRAYSMRHVLRPMGNLVVHPGQTLAVKATDDFMTQTPGGCFIRFRLKGLTTAIRDGDILGGGTLPQVASTNAVAAGGTAAGVAKAIVAADSLSAIEVLGLYFTGSNYNAASDNVRIGFWDGVTGSFAANGSTIHRAYHSGGQPQHAPTILIPDTAGCIQGPIGSGVYIQATANFAGATPTGDWVLVYRKVRATEVLSTSGTAGASPGDRKKWWCVTEALPGGASTIVPFFAFSGNIPANVRCIINGHSGSCTAADDAVAGWLGVGIGADAGTPLLESTYVGGNLAAGTVSNSWATTLLDAPVNTNSLPGFTALFNNQATLAARTQLAWGMFDSSPFNGAGPSRITTIV